MPNEAVSANLALPIRVFLAGLGFLSTWTAGVHAVTFAALPFDVLYGVLTLAVLAGALAQRAARAATDLFSAQALAVPATRLILRRQNMRLRPVLVAAGLCLAFAAAAGIQYKTSAFLPFWALCLAVGIVAVLRPPPDPQDARIAWRAESAKAAEIAPGLGFLLLAFVLLAFYALSSIPDSDDSLFLNLAVGAKHAAGGVYAIDTMLGLPNLPLIKSTYRLESYQLLAAILSALSGASVLMTAHGLLPSLVLVWTASVLILVHRAVLPRDWLASLLFHVAWLAALDGALQSYGAHGIPRFFQGKGPFVTTMVPLIAFLSIAALHVSLRPAVLLLVAALIVSVGFTANAVYAAPLIIVLTAVPFLLCGGRALVLRGCHLGWAVLYPALLVVCLLLFDPPSRSENIDPGSVGAVFWGLMGSNYAHAGALCLFFAAAAAAFASERLRVVSLYVVVLFTVVLNPFLWDAYGQLVTGNINYRLLWAVPVPLILAVLTGLVWRSRNILARAGVLGLLGLAVVAPGSVVHRAEWGFSILKVPQPAFRVAHALNAQLPPGMPVLAPEEIAAWIPVLENGRPVVEARRIYTLQRAGQFGPLAIEQRRRLFEAVSASDGDIFSTAELAALLADLEVCALITGPRVSGSLLAAMQQHAFKAKASYDTYTLSLRSCGAASAEEE